MNVATSPSERSGFDNLFFGGGFLGLLLGAAGLVLTTSKVALSGLILIVLALGYFGIKQAFSR